MKCYMCNSGLRPATDDKKWTIQVPGDERVEVCGRCYMLTVIIDRLQDLIREVKDGFKKPGLPVDIGDVSRRSH